MTFSSVYEMTNPLTTVRKQHFWDWFSGDSLNSRWAKVDLAGTGAIGIRDSVDGGGFMDTGGGATHGSVLCFNDTARSFDYQNSVVIGITKRTTSTSFTRFGLVELISDGNHDVVRYGNSSSSTYTKFETAGTGAQTVTDTDIAVSTNFELVKIQTTSSDSILSVSGVTKATHTTGLPTAKLQPYIYVASSSVASVKGQDVRYFEAYNT
jgi:hypothetical protein